MPILKEAVYPVLTNSPDTFTPDGKWIIGETPEVRYFNGNEKFRKTKARANAE